MTDTDWAPLQAAVRDIGGTAERVADGLSVAAQAGLSATIRVLPPPPAAGALVPRAVLRVDCAVPRARLPGLAADGAAAAAAPLLNRHAAAAAVLADGGALRLVARATLYDGDEAFLPHHHMLVAYAAVWGGVSAIGGAQRLATGRAPNAEGASAWLPETFQAARAQLPSALAVTLDPPTPHALTGNVEAAGGAARIAVRADTIHPLHGPGLAARLTLPLRLAEATHAVTACAMLNALEAEAVDGPPHYGAWFPDQAGHLAYGFFLPNGVPLPIVPALYGWLAMRAPVAAALLMRQPPAAPG
jgi:hypothetical protein